MDFYFFLYFSYRRDCQCLESEIYRCGFIWQSKCSAFRLDLPGDFDFYLFRRHLPEFIHHVHLFIQYLQRNQTATTVYYRIYSAVLRGGWNSWGWEDWNSWKKKGAGLLKFGIMQKIDKQVIWIFFKFAFRYRIIIKNTLTTIFSFS